MSKTETCSEVRTDRKIEDISVSVEEYLSVLYPLEKGEIKRKIVHLWNHYYRINMWGNSYIIRSFFVKAWKENGLWHSLTLPE